MDKLKVPVDQIVDIEVLVVLAKRVDQGLCNVEPAKVEDELEDEEKGNVDVKVSVVVPDLLDQIEQEFSWIKLCCSRPPG